MEYDVCVALDSVRLAVTIAQLSCSCLATWPHAVAAHATLSLLSAVSTNHSQTGSLLVEPTPPPRLSRLPSVVPLVQVVSCLTTLSRRVVCLRMRQGASSSRSSAGWSTATETWSCTGKQRGWTLAAVGGGGMFWYEARRCFQRIISEVEFGHRTMALHR